MIRSGISDSSRASRPTGQAGTPLFLLLLIPPRFPSPTQVPRKSSHNTINANDLQQKRIACSIPAGPLPATPRTAVSALFAPANASGNPCFGARPESFAKTGIGTQRVGVLKDVDVTASVGRVAHGLPRPAPKTSPLFRKRAFHFALRRYTRLDADNVLK